MAVAEVVALRATWTISSCQRECVTQPSPPAVEMKRESPASKETGNEPENSRSRELGATGFVFRLAAQHWRDVVVSADLADEDCHAVSQQTRFQLASSDAAWKMSKRHGRDRSRLGSATCSGPE
jgi:hypothetical protein